MNPLMTDEKLAEMRAFWSGEFNRFHPDAAANYGLMAEEAEVAARANGDVLALLAEVYTLKAMLIMQKTPWISAADRLPDTARPVLGWVDEMVDVESTKDVFPAVVRYSLAGVWEYNRGMVQDDWAPLDSGTFSRRVTHWGELPPGAADA